MHPLAEADRVRLNPERDPRTGADYPAAEHLPAHGGTPLVRRVDQKVGQRGLMAWVLR